MKNFYLVFLLLFSVSTINAQRFSVEIGGGFPVGDADDFYTFGLLANGTYVWSISENFHLGVTGGILYSFGDEIDFGFVRIDVEDAGFIPVAAAARFPISTRFKIGTDIGYAIGIKPSENDGGFYYAPRVHYAVSELIDLVAAFRGISLSNANSANFNHITFGVEFKL